MDLAYGHAHQAQTRQACFGRHAPHLAVFAFGDLHFYPSIGYGFAHAYRRIAFPQLRVFFFSQNSDFGRTGDKIAQIHAAAQLIQSVFTGHAFDLRPICFFDLEFGIGDLCLQATIVGEQEQAFAVGIQAPCRVEMRHVYQGF